MRWAPIVSYIVGFALIQELAEVAGLQDLLSLQSKKDRLGLFGQVVCEQQDPLGS